MQSKYEGKEQITYIGRVNWRHDRRMFGIKDKDRLQHIYTIGKTGTGKSTLLCTLAISDIERGNGLAVMDPHGDISEDLLKRIPKDRINDVIYFNPEDTEYPVAFNPLYNIDPKHQHLVASGIISTFKKIWADSWGPRLEHILRYCLLTILEYGEGSLLDIQPILTEPFYRNHILSYCSNPRILAFWRNEFEKYPPALRAEATAPILNKVSLFNNNDMLRNIVGQKQSLDVETVINTRKILLVNVSKGRIGEDVSALLGSMLITALQLAALRRADMPEQARIPFYAYLDEFQSFVTLSLVDALAECRKYSLGLYLCHQFLDQLSEPIRAAVIGNVGTMVAFRVGSQDAEVLAKEFSPILTASDLVHLPRFHTYIKLMIDGATSRPFSATTLQLLPQTRSFREEVIAASRKNYGKQVIQEKVVVRNELRLF